jgi:hypothetical protein
MIRVEVRLSRREYAAAKREARRLGISLAELLRQSVRNIIPVEHAQAWMRYAGMVESGDLRSTRRIDTVLFAPEVRGRPNVKRCP